MKRRTFVLGGVGAASAWAGWQFIHSSDEDTIAMVVRRRLDYLTLEPQGVLHFARDMAGRHVISSPRMHAIAAFKTIYRRFPLSSGHNALAYKLRHGEDRIVGTYLISSDFFINGENESRLVRYLGMLDSRTACGNPFARPPV